MTEVRVGLCGFTMAFDDYLREYRLVEVQQTFYEPPRDELGNDEFGFFGSMG